MSLESDMLALSVLYLKWNKSPMDWKNIVLLFDFRLTCFSPLRRTFAQDHKTSSSLIYQTCMYLLVPLGSWMQVLTHVQNVFINQRRPNESPQVDQGSTAGGAR